MNYFAYDSSSPNLTHITMCQKIQQNLLLKLEIEITHARMKKQVNLLNKHVLNRNSDEDQLRN